MVVVVVVVIDRLLIRQLLMIKLIRNQVQNKPKKLEATLENHGFGKQFK
jgi:hypothetical protein